MIRNENPQEDPLIVNEYFCDIAKLSRRITLEWKRKAASGQWAVPTSEYGDRLRTTAEFKLCFNCGAKIEDL